MREVDLLSSAYVPEGDTGSSWLFNTSVRRETKFRLQVWKMEIDKGAENQANADVRQLLESLQLHENN